MESLKELSRHGRRIFGISSIRGLGSIFALLFQVMTARLLGPSDYGTFAAVYAVLTISAYGALAFQGSVAVQTAGERTSTQNFSRQGLRRFDYFLLEALVLGFINLIVISLILALFETFSAVPIVYLLAGIQVILSWLFARGLGGLQGLGRSRESVSWSALTTFIRLLLILAAFSQNLGLVGVMLAVVLGSIPATIVALLRSRHKVYWAGRKIFERKGMVVILLSLCVAGLVNIDVVLVQMNSSASTASNYAAASSIVKAVFVFPEILSSYLLPKFAGTLLSSTDRNRGFIFSGLSALVVGIGMIIFSAVFGRSLVGMVFGSGFQLSTQLLVGLSIAFLPMLVAQSLVIRLSATYSSGALVLVAIAFLLQVLGLSILLPNLVNALTFIFFVGVCVVLGFTALHVFARRKYYGPSHPAKAGG